ncbi:MAG: DNA-directed RNA polymerase subunit alpha [Candidatus Omnitrophica bacterium]|nr:DNA-directed RNA polymerase subunit alpha [Candidatus Omnitrophota bacterium]
MGVRWRGFELPKRLKIDEATQTDTYAKFIAEPFERGYGVTIGNALRRVLISSIEGSAVTSLRIEGAPHEYSSLEGVVEDTAEIILNIKKIVLRLHTKKPKIIQLAVSKKGEVKAGDIQTDETVEILNPELVIATLTKDRKFKIDLEVGRGRGYVPSERNKKENQPIGFIAVDSVFSPVKKIMFHVENTRVGQRTDYDKLITEVWTNGSISPKDAMVYSANILHRHLDLFAAFGEFPEEDEEMEEEKSQQEKELLEKFDKSVSELELSVRSANCLREAKIQSIGDMVKKTENDMLKYRNFGKKSLTEIKEMLQQMGLHFGMKIERVDKKDKKD